jgi:Galactose oxidase-like, Early set domain
LSALRLKLEQAHHLEEVMKAEDLDKKIEQAGLSRYGHKRALDVLNRARRPEDLKRLLGDKLNRKDAQNILMACKKCGPYGFRHLHEFIKFEIPDWIIDLILRLFGRGSRGEWTSPYETVMDNGVAYHVAHASVLKNGWVLFMPESSTKTTLLWNAANESNAEFEWMINEPDEKLFCAGHAFLSDGRLLVCGGGGGGPSGVDRAYIFNPDGNSWTATGTNMTRARWYPTVVSLADGRKILVASGAPETGTVEIYDEVDDRFDVVTGPDASRSFPQLYPGLHLLPGGEVYYTRTGFASAGPGPGGNYDSLNTNAYFRLTGPTEGEWVEIEDEMEHPYRARGMSVLLFDDKPPLTRVLIVGGGSPPGSETSELSNLSTINPEFGHATNVAGNEGRNNVNVVMLPNGEALTIGGTVDPDVPCALFDPDSLTWREADRVGYRKQYHSVAVLLPSGKVAATGGSNYGGGSNAIEIFSPPYLFTALGVPAARPQITASPDTAQLGHTFDVDSPQAADIDRVVLVRPMSVTHQTDTCQRVIKLGFTRSGNTLTVQALSHHAPAGLAPPGVYMLFLLNGQGVPSVAEFIQLEG